MLHLNVHRLTRVFKQMHISSEKNHGSGGEAINLLVQKTTKSEIWA